MAKNRPSHRRAFSKPGADDTIGLVVEGETEFYALPLLRTRFPRECPALKPINLHGLGAQQTPVGIAKAVAGKVRAHLIQGRSRVVVCIDREQRSECPGELARTVSTALEKELQGGGKMPWRVHVVVADRTFEAWLLAGSTGFRDRGLFKSEMKVHCFEGNLGEQNRKGVVELSRLLKHEYEKTRDGPRLFRDIDFAAARKHGPGQRGSRSLDKLLRTLGL